MMNFIFFEVFVVATLPPFAESLACESVFGKESQVTFIADALSAENYFPEIKLSFSISSRKQ